MSRARADFLRSRHEHPLRGQPVVGHAAASVRGCTARRRYRLSSRAPGPRRPAPRPRRGGAHAQLSCRPPMPPSGEATSPPSRRRPGRRSTSRCSARSSRSPPTARSPTCSSTASRASGSTAAPVPATSPAGSPTRPRCARSRCGSSRAAVVTSTRRPRRSMCAWVAASAFTWCCRRCRRPEPSSRCACRARPGSRSPRSRAPACSTSRSSSVSARPWPPARTCSSPAREARARPRCSRRCSVRRPSESASSSSKTSPSCRSRIRMSWRSRPGRRTSRARGAWGSTRCCAKRCACGPTGSWSASAEEPSCANCSPR